jgi:4'-phosphopantetheinyl transferase EntD
VIDELLPPGAAFAESFDDSTPAPLFPAEEALLARAVAKRRAEFATARLCARRALAAIDVPPVPILPGTRGAPQWPAGVVGSITHCAGYRAAAVARSSQLTALGVDAEPHAPLPDGVLETIARPAEIEALARLTAAVPEIHWGRLLFSAKESVYKVWSPRTGLWLGFEEAEITFDPEGGRFSAQLLRTPPAADPMPTAFTGRWLVRAGLILTAIAEPTLP